MTAPAKPMIDELINYARSFYADNRFNVAILSTLEAHKRITEAAGRPEPVANIIKAVHEQGCENGCGSMKHCICSYAEDLADHVEKLEAYADRVAAERDDALKATCCDAKEKNEGCYRAVTAERQLAACQKECKEQARLNGMGSEREAKLMAQLAELQAKHDALVKDAERYRWLAGDVPQHSTRWQRWKLEHWHGFHGGWQPLTGSELDEAIDAAMETENAK